MKTVIVDHGGVVQKKILIRDTDELLEYIKVYEKNVVAAFERMLTGGKKIEDYRNSSSPEEKLIEASRVIGKSIVETTADLPRRKAEGMLKSLHLGKTLVVNEGGGYTWWDDKCMKIVEDNIPYERKHKPIHNINNSKVLVIENQAVIEFGIEKFAKSLDGNYSTIVNLKHAEENEVSELIGKAIDNGCDTIVLETTATNKGQIAKFAELFKSLPRFTFHIFTFVDFRKELVEIIGEEEVKYLFSKHNINIHQ